MSIIIIEKECHPREVAKGHFSLNTITSLMNEQKQKKKNYELILIDTDLIEIHHHDYPMS